jgi:hypothetical protein
VTALIVAWTGTPEPRVREDVPATGASAAPAPGGETGAGRQNRLLRSV